MVLKVFFLEVILLQLQNLKITDWQLIKPAILGAIMDHFNSEEETINKSVSNKGSESLKNDEKDSDIVKQIKRIIRHTCPSCSGYGWR